MGPKLLATLFFSTYNFIISTDIKIIKIKIFRHGNKSYGSDFSSQYVVSDQIKDKLPILREFVSLRNTLERIAHQASTDNFFKNSRNIVMHIISYTKKKQIKMYNK